MLVESDVGRKDIAVHIPQRPYATLSCSCILDSVAINSAGAEAVRCELPSDVSECKHTSSFLCMLSSLSSIAICSSKQTAANPIALTGHKK